MIYCDSGRNEAVCDKLISNTIANFLFALKLSKPG